MKIKIIIILIFFAKDFFSQPYYYYFVKQDSTVLSDIHRIDFNDGNDELFIKNAGRINQLFWNSDQTNLFINQRNSVLDVIKLDSLNKYQTINDNFLSIVNIHDAPAINRFLIEYGDNDNMYSYTVIYDRTTNEPLDTINFYTYGGTFLSLDEKKLYKNIWDTTGIYFSAFDIQNNLLLYNNRKIVNYSRPDGMYFDKIDGKRGKALYFESTHGFNQQKFFVVSPDTGLYFDPISIPAVRSRGYLSADAHFVIIQRVNLVIDDINANIGHRVFTGNLQVFNAITGDKISNLSLPANGKVMIFDKFPNMVYYFNLTNHSVTPINLTTLENTEPGLPVKLEDSQGSLLQGGSLQ